MLIINYKEFEISSDSKLRPDSGKWTVRVSITNHRDANKKSALFDANPTFPNKDEAELQSLIFGEKIIDGEVPGYSVEGLTKLADFAN